MSEAPHYNGQSDPRLQAIAEAERERFHKQNGAGIGGHPSANGAAAAPLWTEERLSEWARRDIPPREWIMEDWIPCGQTTGLYGVSGVLKTTFLIQLMMAASAGLVFCGVPLAAVPAYGLFCEDTAAEIVRRAALIAASYELELDAFPDFHFASLVGVDDTEIVNFDNGRMSRGPVCHLLAERISVHQAKLAVLDTIPDFFGGEEVNRRQTSRFIRVLDGIGMAYGCAIVGSAHPSMRGRASGRLDSGNTGIEGKMRARLTLHDPGEAAEDDETPEERAYRTALNPSDRRVLTRANSNYARPGEMIDLVFRDGAFWPAALDPGAAKLRGPMRDQACKASFLDLLAQVAKEGRYVNDAANVPSRYAPRVFAPHPHNQRARFSAREFTKAMQALLADGRIKMITASDGHNQHREFVQC